MESLWHSPNNVDLIRFIAQWIAVISTIIALVFGMRFSTLKTHAEEAKIIKDTETKALLDEKIKATREQLESVEIRPFTFRLKELLNEIDPQILPRLKKGKSFIEIHVNQSQYVRLHNLCAEKEAVAYITLDPTEEKTGIISDNKHTVDYRIHVQLNPRLISKTVKNK
jgi:hypothetical protein